MNRSEHWRSVPARLAIMAGFLIEDGFYIRVAPWNLRRLGMREAGDGLSSRLVVSLHWLIEQREQMPVTATVN